MKPIYLHIGAPKTGTTYLQGLLGLNRQTLRDRGVLYPKTVSDAHHAAAWDLRDTPRQRQDVPNIEGSWGELVRRVNAWDGPVVISSELFVYADADVARRGVADLSGDVHLIYTARDLLRQVPAVWQERIKNQQAMEYASFVDALTHRRGGASQGFWRSQDAAEVLQRWGATLPPKRIHVVTTPPAGAAPTVLWDRFLSVLGVDGSGLATEMPGLTNPSLGLVATELLRRYNKRHGKELPWPVYRRTIRVELERSFQAAISDEQRVSLSAGHQRHFAAESTRICRALEAAGYDIVGDLGDLRSDVAPGRLPAKVWAGRSERVDAETLLDAAVDVLHRILTREEQRRRRRRQRRRSGKGRPASRPLPPEETSQRGRGGPSEQVADPPVEADPGADR